MATYNLAELWPEFDRLWIGDFTSSEGLSAAFVFMLLSLLTLFLGLSIKHFIGSKRKLKFYSSLIEGLAADELLEKRREINNKALRNDVFGQLWREFDESLVHIDGKQRLCNTLDAAHFFNSHTIARRLTDNRLLAAVPGFLTAIGVIGTFAGLQMGLSSLNANMAGTPQIDELTSGIFGMIGGASIAFMTSVWGVFTSVLFNFIEKVLERSIRSSISRFQNRVDYLYPRITAEQSLSNIEDFSRQSTEKLAELDEKIGDRLQEVMQEASRSMREGLEESIAKVLGPALEKLVDNAHSGSEVALDSLLTRFMDKFGEAGDAQRVMMDKASSQMGDVTESMVRSLDGFIGKMETQLDDLLAKNSKVVSGMQSALMGQMDSQQERELERQSLLVNQLGSFQDSQESLKNGLQSTLDSQKSQQIELAEGLTELLSKFSDLAQVHQTASEAMKIATSEMRQVSSETASLGLSVKTASSSLGEKIEAAVNGTIQLVKENTNTLQMSQELLESLTEASETIENTAELMGSAPEKAESGLDAVGVHFEAVSESMKRHVAELQEQVAKLLADYGEQVKGQTVERMNTWNEQTNQYTSAMTNAVNALSSVVDDIDIKLRAGER